LGNVWNIHFPVDGRPFHLDVVIVEFAGFEARAVEEKSEGKQGRKMCVQKPAIATHHLDRRDKFSNQIKSTEREREEEDVR
jgi:hypothetical protein